MYISFAYIWRENKRARKREIEKKRGERKRCQTNTMTREFQFASEFSLNDNEFADEDWRATITNTYTNVLHT